MTTRLSADERRETLIEAAVEAFAAYGLHGTAVSRITDAVGITQPYAFTLFKSKKGLFLAAVEHSFVRLEAVFRTAVEEVPMDQRIAAMGQAYGELLASDPRLLQFHLQCFAASGETEVRDVVKALMERLFHLVQELAEVGPDEARAFLGQGMLCILTNILDLDILLPDEIREQRACASTRTPG